MWEVFESIQHEPLEQVDRRLKALDLLVKIRSQGEKVKAPTTETGDDGGDQTARQMAKKILDRMNG